MREHLTPSKATFAKELGVAMAATHRKPNESSSPTETDAAISTPVVHTNWSAPTTPQRSVAAVLLYVPPQTNPEDDQRHKARMRMLGRSPPAKRKAESTAPSAGLSSASRNLFNTRSPRKPMANTADSPTTARVEASVNVPGSGVDAKHSTEKTVEEDTCTVDASASGGQAQSVLKSHVHSDSSQVQTQTADAQPSPKRARSAPTTPVKSTQIAKTLSIASADAQTPSIPPADAQGKPIGSCTPPKAVGVSAPQRHTPTTHTPVPQNKIASDVSGRARAQRYSPTKATRRDSDHQQHILNPDTPAITKVLPNAHVARALVEPDLDSPDGGQRNPTTTSCRTRNVIANGDQNTDSSETSNFTGMESTNTEVSTEQSKAHKPMGEDTRPAEDFHDLGGPTKSVVVDSVQSQKVLNTVRRKSTRINTLPKPTEDRSDLHITRDMEKTLVEKPANLGGLSRSERLFASVRGFANAPPTRTRLGATSSPVRTDLIPTATHTHAQSNHTPTRTHTRSPARTPAHEVPATHACVDTPPSIGATKSTLHSTSGANLAEIKRLFTAKQINRRLPPAYELLSQMQSAIDLALRHRKGLKENLTFDRAQTWIHQSLHKTFTEKHLTQLMAVWPEIYHLQRELSQKVSELRTATTYREKFMLLIDADLSHTTPEGKVLHTSIKTIQDRQTQFRLLLLKRTLDLHRKFVIANGFTAEYDDEVLKNWHPGFDLNDVPEIEEAAIPQPPPQQYESAAEVLSRAGQMSEVVRLALEKAAANRRKRENTRNVWQDSGTVADRHPVSSSAQHAEGVHEGSSAEDTLSRNGEMGKFDVKGDANKCRKARSGAASRLGTTVHRPQPSQDTTLQTQGVSGKSPNNTQAHPHPRSRRRADTSASAQEISEAVTTNAVCSETSGGGTRKGMSDTVMAALARAKRERQALKDHSTAQRTPATKLQDSCVVDATDAKKQTSVGGIKPGGRSTRSDTSSETSTQSHRLPRRTETEPNSGAQRPQLTRVKRKQLIPDTLLARVKAKGEMKARQQMFGLSQARSEELALVERLPSMALLLHSLYDVGQGQITVSASRSVLPLDNVAEKLQATYRPRLSIDKMYASIRLLLKYSPPGWISEFTTDNGSFLKINKQMSVSDVKEELERHRGIAVAERESARVLVNGGAIDMEEAKVQATKIRQTALAKHRMMVNKLL